MLRAIVSVNVTAALVFLLLGLSCLWADVSVRANFVALDRAGAVNIAGLSKFHQSYGFDTTTMGYRNTVPRYVAGPAMSAAWKGVVVGLLLAVLNTALSATLLVRTTKAREDGEEKEEDKGDADRSPVEGA